MLTSMRVIGINQPIAPSSPSANNSLPRSSSQPAPASKNVAFDLESEGSQLQSPDGRRHQQRRGETSRGYEAEDDSESTLDGRDKRYPTHHPISETESDPEQSARRRKRHRRHRHPDDHHRSHDDDDDDRHHRHSRRSSRNHHPSSSSSARDARPPSPARSDVTVDLPDRFDKEGRRKSERGDDAVADILEDIISGKGPGGKYFKKIFGGGSTDDDDDHDSGGGEDGGDLRS